MGMISEQSSSRMCIEIFDSIDDIGEADWNQMFPNSITMQYDWVKLAEEQTDDLFLYYIVRFQSKLLLGTVLTISYEKAELYCDKDLSEAVVEFTNTSGVNLNQKVISTGVSISAGNQIWIDRNNPNWSQAIKRFLADFQQISIEHQCDLAVLRYFDVNDTELMETIGGSSLRKMDAPKAFLLKNISEYGSPEWLQSLKSKARYDWKRRYSKINNIDVFSSEFVDLPNFSERQLNVWYQLYLNVNKRSSVISTRSINLTYFRKMLQLKDSLLLVVRDSTTSKEIGFMFGKFVGDYCSAILVGMDYKYLGHRIYNYLLYMFVLGVKERGLETIGMGITADLEKKILGCQSVETCLFYSYIDVPSSTMDDYVKGLIELK